MSKFSVDKELNYWTFVAMKLHAEENLKVRTQLQVATKIYYSSESHQKLYLRLAQNLSE